MRCRATAPEVAQVARRYLEGHEDLAIIGIGSLDSPDAMQEFVDEYGITFPNLIDERAELWVRFDIALQGAWYFIDDGGATERIPFDLSGEQLAAELDQLLAS